LVFSSDADLKSFIIPGSVKGKRSSTTLAADTRSILPLPALLEIADAILANKVNEFINSHFAPLEGVYHGAVKGTQTAEIAGGFTLAVERGADCFGKVAIADCDLQKFYDMLDPLIFHRWAISHGMDIGLATSVLRFVALPTISLTSGGAQVSVVARTRGFFTGSRVAGAVGRIPLHDSIDVAYEEIASLGLQVGSATLVTTVWIDNLTSISSDANSAVKILEVLLETLRRRWQIAVKPSSRRYASMRPTDTCSDALWRREDLLELLGHFVDIHGGLAKPFGAVSNQIWTAFYKRVDKTLVKNSGALTIARIVNRYLLPLLSYRWILWPFSKTLALRIDALHARLLAALIPSAPLPTEDVASFHCRRCREAGRIASRSRTGAWSHMWAKGVIKWHGHIVRNSSGKQWSSHILKWRDDAFLQKQRKQFVPKSTCRSSAFTLEAGRTNTRYRAGPPPVRWTDGVATAAEALAEAGVKQVIKRHR
jgi:hypothetical protein